MNNFDPRMYAITIRIREIDGDKLYIGSVKELPDVRVYEISHKRAYKNVVDVISVLREMAISELAEYFWTCYVAHVKDHEFSY